MEQQNQMLGFAPVQLKIMECPTCGAKLKYKPGDKEVVCMCCGNTYLLSEFGGESSLNGRSQGMNAIKVDGIKTSSSALAYIEQFLDSYDWESFASDTYLEIDELTKVVDDLKVTSADDFKTWIACFIVRVVPFSKKIELRPKMYQTLINEYEKDNLDSFGMYDAYKNVSSFLVKAYKGIKEEAEKYIVYAEKYNAPKEEIAHLRKMLNDLSVDELSKTLYPTIEDIPEIISFNEERQNQLVKALAEVGIDAETEYQNALSLLEQKQYVQALVTLYKINGFKDTRKLIEKTDQSFVLSKNVFFNQGNIFYLKEDSTLFNLYRANEQGIDKNPIAKSIYRVVAIYADSLYYVTENNQLRGLSLTTNTKIELKPNLTIKDKTLFIIKENAKAYFSSVSEGDVKLYQLDFLTNTLKRVAEKIKKFVGFKSHYAVYQQRIENKKAIIVKDLNSAATYEISNVDIDPVCFFDNKLLFTTINPEEFNKALWLYDFEKEEKIILEKNITDLPKVVDGHIYYFSIDNLKIKRLITIDVDGSNRQELSPYVKEVLFISGDWLYFIKGYGYNTALCKMHLDGSHLKTIASQIDEFIKIDCGYLYYVDDDRDLRRVRMDGSRKSLICYDVKDVFVINNEKVIYSAYDKKKMVSIYAIDFDKQGRRKASYDVLEAGLYDENTIYFINKRYPNNIKNDDQSPLTYLNVLNTNTYEEKCLFKVGVAGKSGCYVATCVYNSYDCPEVWRLRRYRDYYLDNHWWGKLFIKVYYAISPKLVKAFGEKKWFRNPIKKYLDKKLTKLEKNGYQDTPYIDKY